MVLNIYLKKRSYKVREGFHQKTANYPHFVYKGGGWGGSWNVDNKGR